MRTGYEHSLRGGMPGLHVASPHTVLCCLHDEVSFGSMVIIAVNRSRSTTAPGYPCP